MARRTEPDLDALMGRLGYRFLDPSLLRLALVHRSFQSENDEPDSNERLEFLGDAVLGWVVADHSFHRLPDDPEGRLSDLRQAVVNTHALAERAREIDLGSFVMLGRGEATGGGRDKDSILADTFEAVIGAVYLDGGDGAARDFVVARLSPSIEEMIPRIDTVDAKTALQEMCTDRGWEPPRYETHGEGPDHDRLFTAHVFVNGRMAGSGTGRSKKAAEQVAARQAVAGSGD